MKITGTLSQKYKKAVIITRKKYVLVKKKFFEFIAYMKSPRSNAVYAACGYIPFIGWLVPLYLRNKSDVCQKAGKQGYVLSVIAASVLFAFFLLELFVPHSLKAVMFALIVLTYIFNFCYLALSAFAIYQTAYGRLVRIPWISEKSEKLYL